MQDRIVVSSDDDCRDIKAISYQMFSQLLPAHGGHLKIDYQAPGRAVGQRSKKLLPGSVCVNIVRVGSQQPAQSLEHGRIIVDHSNPGRNLRHKRLLRPVPLPVELTVGPIGHGLLSSNSGLFSQPDQIGNASNTQLFHHPAAVHLDGFFYGTKIAGNLLVEPAGDHVHEHFAFSRC